MNERIRELAEQARAWVNNTDNVSPDIEYVFYKDAYDKKFAELIVKECYQVCKNNLVPLSEYDSDEAFKYNEGVTDCAIMINRHFGVEE